MDATSAAPAKNDCAKSNRRQYNGDAAMTSQRSLWEFTRIFASNGAHQSPRDHPVNSPHVGRID